MHEIAPRYPQAFGHLLQALAWLSAQRARWRSWGPVGMVRGAADRGPRRLPPADRARRRGGADARVPLLEGREPVDGRATAYVCEHFACRLPVTAPGDLARELQD